MESQKATCKSFSSSPSFSCHVIGTLRQAYTVRSQGFRPTAMRVCFPGCGSPALAQSSDDTAHGLQHLEGPEPEPPAKPLPDSWPYEIAPKAYEIVTVVLSSTCWGHLSHSHRWLIHLSVLAISPHPRRRDIYMATTMGHRISIDMLVSVLEKLRI
jgi:hypothetical protein